MTILKLFQGFNDIYFRKSGRSKAKNQRSHLAVVLVVSSSIHPYDNDRCLCSISPRQDSYNFMAFIIRATNYTGKTAKKKLNNDYLLAKACLLSLCRASRRGIRRYYINNNI